jgi:hypothetical protein
VRDHRDEELERRGSIGLRQTARRSLHLQVCNWPGNQKKRTEGASEAHQAEEKPEKGKGPKKRATG